MKNKRKAAISLQWYISGIYHSPNNPKLIDCENINLRFLHENGNSTKKGKKNHENGIKVCAPCCPLGHAQHDELTIDR